MVRSYGVPILRVNTVLDLNKVRLRHTKNNCEQQETKTTLNQG